MKKTILQKPILFIIIILVVGSLVGCADNVIEENTQEQIDAIPFSFVGEEGDWKAVVEYRQITEDDLKLLENMTEDKTREELLQDFRSVVRITYTGDQLLERYPIALPATLNGMPMDPLKIKVSLSSCFPV
jgi:hypothetical protein